MIIKKLKTNRNKKTHKKPNQQKTKQKQNQKNPTKINPQNQKKAPQKPLMRLNCPTLTRICP